MNSTKAPANSPRRFGAPFCFSGSGFRIFILLLCLNCLSMPSIIAQDFVEIKKLLALDAAADDEFGYSVSISGDVAIVGALFDDDGGTNSGSVYIFSKDGLSGEWGEVKKLTASDAAADDQFGISVSISGDVAIVGAYLNDDAGTGSGSAYIFSKDEGGMNNWGEVKKLTASDAMRNDGFGYSVSVSGDIAIVGASWNDDAGTNSGSVYIFSKDEGGMNNWGEVKKLAASAAAVGEQFGNSVSISGNVAIVGARWNNDAGTNSGSAYIFSKDEGGMNNWGEVKKLTASDAAAQDLFGWSVSIVGDVVIVGAYGNDDAGTSSGSAYIFSKDEGGVGNWGEVKKLTASDAAVGDRFGNSVSVSGDIAIVGAYTNDDDGSNSGSAYIFAKDEGGVGNWGEVRKLTASDAAGGDQFGYSVSVSGDIAIVGARFNDDDGSNSSSAYIFGPASCELQVSCPDANDLGTYDCNTGLPACPAVLTDANGNVTVDDADGSYGIDLGDEPCGELMLDCSDFPVANLCTATDQAITRTIFIWDDLDGGTPGVFDPNMEESMACTFTYRISGVAPPSIDCPADNTIEVDCYASIDPPTLDWTESCGQGGTVDGDLPDFTSNCLDTEYEVTYMVMDACQRPAECTITYVVTNEGPVIACPDLSEAERTVSCYADIAPPTLDWIGSCGQGGTVDGDLPDFTSNCPATEYEVTYMVMDACQRPAECTITYIIDNDAPMITAFPADEEVVCSSDIAASEDAIIFTTSCGLGGTVSAGPVTPEDGNNDCGEANGDKYTITYIVTDACDRPAEYTQTFTIVNPDPGPTIAVVPNLTFDCFESINLNPAWATVTTTCNTGYEVFISGPEINYNSNCPDISYFYTYTVIDDCGRIDQVGQTVHIENDGPTMDCPDNCEVFGCYDGNAQAVIDAWINTVTATSSCNDALTVYHEIEGEIGTCINNGITPITFTATDDCNPERMATCESLIIIIDDDEPIFSEQPADLLVPCTYNTYGDFEDWLNNHGGAAAYDDCDQSLEWSYEPEDALELLDCDNGPQAIIVTFTAEDDCGNTASATATFSTKLLPNQVNVAGLIQTEAAEAVAAVEVAAYQSSGMTAMDVSDDTGDYGFEELPFEEDTEIVPARTGDWLNGLSTYDLILLQQHILGLQELDSPYKRIAADANRSGTISTLDLVLLRRLILHLDEELEDNTSWRFVNSDFVFPNPADPFETEFPEAYTLSGEEEDWASFVAVKIGDLNLDAATNSFNSGADDRSGLKDLIFEIEDQKLKAGQEYEIEVSSDNFEAIRGFQLTLEYNHSLISVLDINGDALADFDAANYNLAFIEQGRVLLSWNTQRAKSLSSEDVALRVIIKAKANINLSEVLSISSSLTRAEAYNNTDLMNVALQFTNNGTSVVEDRFELFQNQPNPFMKETTIGFVIPEAGAVTLELFHISGKLVYQQRGEYAEGYNQIDMDRAGLPGGVYYYKVSTELHSRSKKMIVLE